MAAAWMDTLISRTRGRYGETAYRTNMGEIARGLPRIERSGTYNVCYPDATGYGGWNRSPQTHEANKTRRRYTPIVCIAGFESGQPF